MGYCADCGTRTLGGICSNCQEELYIEIYQSEDYDYPLGNEFRKKVAEQRDSLLRQLAERRTKEI